jgi:hypothetical protein
MPKPVEPQEMGSFVDEVPARPAAVKIEAGEQPVAFGNLLDTSGASTEAEAPEFASTPPALGMDRDWRSVKEEDAEEEQEEPSGKGSWRRDGGEEEPSVVSEDKDEVAESSRDFRHHGGQGTWSPTREKSDTPESEPENVPAGMMDRRDMPATPPFSGDAWAAAIETHSNHKTSVAEEEHPTPHAADLEKMVGHVEPVVAEEPAPVEQVAPVEASTPFVNQESVLVVEPQKSSPVDSWFSTPPPNPWEAEAQKVNRLASAWDSTVAVPAHGDSSARGDVSFEPGSAPDEIEVVTGANSEVVAAAAETVREEASHAVEQAERQADSRASSAEASEAVHDAAANMDMDAVVAKVLARLSPGLLHDATRDILKPVVEAVIREELNSKKS